MHHVYAPLGIVFCLFVCWCTASVTLGADAVFVVAVEAGLDVVARLLSWLSRLDCWQWLDK
jgi:hypothetical protein